MDDALVLDCSSVIRLIVIDHHSITFGCKPGQLRAKTRSLNITSRVQPSLEGVLARISGQGRSLCRFPFRLGDELGEPNAQCTAQVFRSDGLHRLPFGHGELDGHISFRVSPSLV